MAAVNEKGSLEAAWLASILLESLHPSSDRPHAEIRVTGDVLDMVDGLDARRSSFDRGAQERIELLASVAALIRLRSHRAAHLQLLDHMARGLLVQSCHVA